MTRTTRLLAAFAFGAGLTAAGVALAQTQTSGTLPPAPAAQPAPPPDLSTPPSLSPEASPTKPWDPDAIQPTYSVNPPPDGSSGIYLPAVVLGYAKSAAGCVVIGCNDGPQVGRAAGSPPSGSAQPAPANPATSGPH